MKHLLALTAVALLLPSPARAEPFPWDVLFPEFLTLPFGTTVEIDAWLRPGRYEPQSCSMVSTGATHLQRRALILPFSIQAPVTYMTSLD